MSAGEPLWLTTAETAALLRRHPRTIERMCRRGDLGSVPVRKIGGAWLISRDGLMRWLTG